MDDACSAVWQTVGMLPWICLLYTSHVLDDRNIPNKGL